MYICIRLIIRHHEFEREFGRIGKDLKREG
jgi:hypothetical protein